MNQERAYLLMNDFQGLGIESPRMSMYCITKFL